MNKHLVVILLVAALAVPGCGLARLGASAPSQGMSEENVLVERSYALAEAPQAAEVAGVSLDTSAAATSSERLVIQNASVTVVVADPTDSIDEIARMAEEMGGFVVSSYVGQATFGLDQILAEQGSITIRVPSERLDEALERIEAGAIEVRSRNVSGEDVTSQYTDLASRLRNLQAAEEQLREIMASASRTEDVMLVFNQLTQVRGEIEMIQGQMRYYEESARLSAISVELIPSVADQPLQIGGWHPEGTAKEALEDLIRGLQTLVDLLIRFGICGIPFLVIFGLPTWLVIRAIVRRRRAKKAAAPPEA